MSCIYKYKGKKYSEEQFKEYFINNKQEFTTSIAKNKDVIDSFKRKMEGIDFVFSQSPELASVGSKAQYLQYLSTIFKTSKVKDIVYHGTDAQFDKFDKSFYQSGADYIYFGKLDTPGFKNLSRVIPAILNLKNPSSFIDNKINKVYNEDGFIEDYTPKFMETASEEGEFLNQYGVKEPEQIHILGSKQDTQGFKNFVQGKQFQKLTAEEKAKTIEQVTKEQNNSLLQKEGTESSVASEKTLDAVKSFLNSIGVKIETTELKDVNGVADILHQLIQLSSGKENVTLTEEAMHFAVELLEQKNQYLFNKLFNKVEKYNLYNEVLEQYKNDEKYQLKDGSPNINKIKKEAIGKLLAEYFIKNEEGITSNPVLLKQTQTWMEMLVNFIKKLFSNKGNAFEQAINEIKKGELGKASDLNSNEKYFQIKNEYVKTAQQKESVNTGEGIKEIERQAKDFILDETDPNNTFYKKGATILARATEFITEVFSSKEKNEKLGRKTQAEWLTDRYFKTMKTDRNNPVIWTKTGGMVSYQEALELFQEEMNKTQAKGNIIHAIFQNFINPSDKNRAKINELISNSEFEPGVFTYLNNDFLSGLLGPDGKLGLQITEGSKGTNLEDIVASETIVGSDKLGLAGTIDMLVQHGNNEFSIIDLKTGALLSDLLTAENMNFSNIINDIVKDNKLNKAQMQVMMYAFLIKMNNPDAKFRQLSIIHLQGRKLSDANVYKVSMENYLQIIENYYRTERTDLYQELKQKGMFDFQNYNGTSKETAFLEATNETVKGMTNAQKIAYYVKVIENIRLRTANSNRKLSVEEENELKEYTIRLSNARLNNSKELHSDQLDMSTMKRWVGSIYEVSHPMIQTFLKLFTDRSFAAKHEYSAIEYTANKLMNKVLDEYKAKNPNKKALQESIGVGNSYLYHSLTGDGSGLYDFMWQKTTPPGSEAFGWYANIITEEDVKTGKYTQAQYEYNKFHRETTHALYIKTMRQNVGKGLTKENLWGGDTTLIGDYFMPRTPLTREEMMEREGIFSPEIIKQIFSDYTTTFLKMDVVSRNDSGLPVKYVGNTRIITSSAHSFNAHEGLLKFSQAMINKYHLDPVEAVGNTTIMVLKEEKDLKNGKEKYKNLIAFTEDFIKNQLTNDKEDIKAQRKPATFKLFGKEWQVDYQGIALSSNTLVSASAMWLSVPAATFNAAMNGLYATSKALQGSILKKFGYDYDYSFSDLMAASSDYFKHGVFSTVLKNGDTKIIMNQDDKMHRFVEMMNYDTNTFRNIISKNKLLGAKNRLLDQGKLYFMHGISEEFSLYTTMIALLRHQKLQDGQGNHIKIESDGSFTKTDKKNASSMWDAYEVTEEGEFKYKGPTRGVLTSGEELKGLTTEEITKMRRVSARIYGGYREDEKTAIEGYLLGKLFMKFKKYIPNILTMNFQSKFKDESLGKYVPYLENGIPKIENGMSVYQWQAQLNQGRVQLIGQWLQAVAFYKFSKDPKYKNYLDDMGPEQKKLLVDTSINILLALSLMLAAMGIPEDEKKKKWYQRFDRLHGDIIGINPFDLARTGKEGLIQAGLVYKLMNASYDFFYRGLLMGEVNETGKYIGQHPGEHTLKVKTPFINILNQFGSSDEDDPFILNRR